MNKYTYNYRCYKFGEYIYGVLNVNSKEEDKEVYDKVKKYLDDKVPNRFCNINFDSKSKSDQTYDSISHNTHFKLPVSYAAK